jgi:hypothetical protein
VAGGYEVPASSSRVLAADDSHAREVYVQMVHVAAKVPPWKPYIRKSIEHASAVLVRSPHR